MNRTVTAGMRRRAIRELERAIALLEKVQHMPGARDIDLGNAKSDAMRRLGELERFAAGVES